MQTLVQSAFLQSLGWAIVQSTWQITILWLLYKGVSRVCFQKNHGARISLAMLSLLAGFLTFIITAVLHYNAPAAVGFSGNILLSKATALVDRILPYLSVLYLFFLIGGALKFVRSFGYVKALQVEKHGKMPFEWRLFTRENAAILGISKKVNIWLSELADSPVTVGFFKPMILIPVSMVNQLSSEQMEAVILHELAHIKRNDYILNILLAVMEAVLFFHPFVHLLGKEIRKDREFLCDDLVLQFRYKPASYAAALLQAEKNRLVLKQSRFQLAAIGEKDMLMERVYRITGMHVRKKTSFKPVIAALLLLLLGVFAVKAPLIREQNTGESASRNFGEYPMAIASLFPERSTTIISSETISEENVEETSVETEMPPADATAAVAEISPEAYFWKEEPVEDFIQVAEKEYSIVVDGEKYTGKVTAAPVEVEHKPFSLTLTRDSTALLLYNLVQGEYSKALDLGKLSAFLDKLDWEKIAYEQAKGMESVQLIQAEIAKAMKDIQWEQLKALSAEVTLEMENVKLNTKTADSLRVIAKKKARPVIRL